VSPTTNGLNDYRYRIYESLLQRPRLRPHHLSRDLRLRPSSVSKIMKEAFKLGYIGGPQCRKKSYRNLREYVYIIRSPDPVDQYLRFREDSRIVYHTKMIGFSDIWAVTNEDIHIDGDIVVKGPRSDYYMSFALNCSWIDSLQTANDMVRNFDPSSYVPRKYIQNHWNETIEWDNTDEILFQEMKYDLRNPLEPVMRKYKIPRTRINKWLKRLPECCTIVASYYPETITAYDPYLFMFETEYEDFIVELFSQLPVSTFFFKVADKLFVYFHVKKELSRTTGKDAIELDKLRIPVLVEELYDRGIVTNDSYAIAEYFWGKDL
jgi:hypothetical protein